MIKQYKKSDQTCLRAIVLSFLGPFYPFHVYGFTGFGARCECWRAEWKECNRHGWRIWVLHEWTNKRCIHCAILMSFSLFATFWVLFTYIENVSRNWLTSFAREGFWDIFESCLISGISWGKSINYRTDFFIFFI